MKDLYLYNSLSKEKELFKPFNDNFVGMYSCGFTVYDHTHIGHIKKYVGDDILRRVLEINGYKVKHVQNVTDVGHLTSDADSGEDKLEKGAKKYNVDIKKLALGFEKEFYDALRLVNVLTPTVIERAASDSAIAKQKELIQELLDNGFAYIKDSAIYFDVSKLSNYNPFSNQSAKEKIVGKREGVLVDPEKKNPSDFVLWMFTKGKYENHIMRWDSPWGEGFPGWHIECSAISMENLGEHIDIHTGGIDHLEIHHPNEIAQNEGVCGHSVVKYWVHHNFLLVDGKKMSKSLENFYTIKDVEERGYSPMDLRYLILGTHYRKQLNFTWEALTGAKNTLERLYSFIDESLKEKNISKNDVKTVSDGHLYEEFINAINDDLNMPVALSVVWETVKSNEDVLTRLGLLRSFDRVLGLKLFDERKLFIKDNSIDLNELPSDIEELVRRREEARLKKDWKMSDELRDKLKKRGYNITDKGKDFVIRKNS